MNSSLLQKDSSDFIGQRNLRIEKVQKLRDMGYNPYPSRSKRNSKTKDLVDKFEELQNQEFTIAGRLMSWREHGQLVFGHIQDQSGKIQLYIKAEEILSANKEKETLGFAELNLIDVGDILEATGVLSKTERGEISIMVKEIKILTKSLRPMPTKMEDKEERFRRRYLDMVLHPEVRQRFERRSKFWEATREFLDMNGFFEVNIPVLEHTTGGADAKPFTTHYDALDEDFFLRISHELPLKRLIGAGFEKVYDLGPRFRNEGFSDEHLPEHVALEWYWAYADYKDGMKFIEELFRYVMQKVYGTLQFTIKGFEVDLSKEWGIIDYCTIIKERYDIDVMNDSIEKMREVLRQNGNAAAADPELNRNRAVDNIWKMIRKTIGGPAFLTGVPKFMSPLAKTNLENPDLTDRFHPLIGGSELGNGFSELNDPQDQLERFWEQEQLRESGDDEAQMLDIDYVEMLEYGMPPAVGWGHSERVFWFFENVTAKEGVPFPQLKFDLDNTTKKIYKDYLKGSKENVVEQDFSKKIVIVVDKTQESWKILNTVGHISAYLGNKIKDKLTTGENFVSSDDFEYPRNSQYPIIVLAGDSKELKKLSKKVKDSGLLHHIFIDEMIQTTNDQDIVDMLKTKSSEEITALGVGVFGTIDEVNKLTKSFSVYRV